MKKEIIGIVLLCCGGSIYAQSYSYDESENHPMEMVAAPSVYEMTDEVRNALGLDHNQFEKVYSAYDKYNTAIFGNTSGSNSSRPAMGNGGPGGRGGGGMPGGGGPGGPGGMQGGGPGGMMGGGPDGMPSGNMQMSGEKKKESAPKPLSEKELKKRQEKIEKQEKTLDKKMAKILNDDQKYQQWLQIREGQISRLFPAPPKEYDKK